jgi:hypothetical protein
LFERPKIKVKLSLYRRTRLWSLEFHAFTTSARDEGELSISLSGSFIVDKIADDTCGAEVYMGITVVSAW